MKKKSSFCVNNYLFHLQCFYAYFGCQKCAIFSLIIKKITIKHFCIKGNCGLESVAFLKKIMLYIREPYTSM